MTPNQLTKARIIHAVRSLKSITEEELAKELKLSRQQADRLHKQFLEWVNRKVENKDK